MRTLCNTTGFALGQLGGHVALAVWAGLRSMPGFSFSLLTARIFYPTFIPSFTFKEVFGRYTLHSGKICTVGGQ
ncbi:hypothetical protein TSMEX_005615 [Taenia solium]|eukprot:TsM_000266500 transcript=TsM_000266500 gene=TsM_000266500